MRKLTKTGCVIAALGAAVGATGIVYGFTGLRTWRMEDMLGAALIFWGGLAVASATLLVYDYLPHDASTPQQDECSAPRPLPPDTFK